VSRGEFSALLLNIPAAFGLRQHKRERFALEFAHWVNSGAAMIVCVCRRVSHRDIEREVRAGCSSFEELQDELGVATACGACVDCAQTTFDKACGERNACGHHRVVPIGLIAAAAA